MKTTGDNIHASSIPSPATSGNEITLNIPKRGSNEMYLGHMINTLSNHRAVITTLSGLTDPRIIPMTRECIVGILDDGIRTKLMAAYEYGIEYAQSKSDLDPAQKGALIIEISQNAIGQVYSYLDEFIGLSKTNALIPMCTEPTLGATEAAKRVIDDSDDMPDLRGALIDHEEEMT